MTRRLSREGGFWGFGFFLARRFFVDRFPIRLFPGHLIKNLCSTLQISELKPDSYAQKEFLGFLIGTLDSKLSVVKVLLLNKNFAVFLIFFHLSLEQLLVSVFCIKKFPYD